MADLDKMDRTWLCSVMFMDIANYSSQSVELQMKWKKRFNAYLTDAIHDVPEGERVILDTGDGAAVCFLAAPEAAMFAALQLARSFSLDEREQQPGLRVRLGINLGPVKLVRDLNGALNAIGDGINAGQRIMSFASANSILVSQSFFEVVSRLSDDYKLLFQLKGVERDKHVREHTVYHLVPPGSENRAPTITNADGRTVTAAAITSQPAGRSWTPWLLAGTAMAAFAALAFWHFRGTAAPALVVNAAPQAAAPQTSATQTQSSAPVTRTNTPPRPVVAAAATETTPVSSQADIAGRGRLRGRRMIAGAASGTPPSPEAKTAYDAGMRLIDENNPTEASRQFDIALRATPDYLDALAGRAEARRMLVQYDLSLQDCAKIIQLKADEPKGYLCRGATHQVLKQLEPALTDFTEALRLNPDLVMGYEHRGTTYELLQQYDHAAQDLSDAIRLAPRNAVFYIRRGGLYSNLKQYDKAIRDFTEAIRLQPNNKNAYRMRALAEQASGDAAGAAADRNSMKEAPGRKNR